MELILSFFRLIRLPNLFIVILAEWLLYERIIIPAYEKAQLSPVLTTTQFWLLVLAIVMVTAAGYVINDIIDYPIDIINKPQKVVVNRVLSNQFAQLIYFSLVLGGFLISEVLAFSTQKIHLLWLYPLATVGLYSYSLYFKKRPFIGNLVVAFFCAGVAALIWVAELDHIHLLTIQQPLAAKQLKFILTLYITFAFLSTWYREIIKDLEDVDGDAHNKLQTLPIIWGKKRTKELALAVGTGLLLTIIYGIYFLEIYQTLWPSIFIGILIVIPLIWSMVALYQASTNTQFHRLSGLTKFVMVSGIILLILIAI